MKPPDHIDGALAPTLTAWDLRVLRALPARDGWGVSGEYHSAWQIAEAVREEDVRQVRLTLNGLEDRQLAQAIRYAYARRWQRTDLGDAYLDPKALHTENTKGLVEGEG